MAQLWPMIGREAECAAILGGLRAGLGTVIVGAAGVGKSVLAREVAISARREGWRTALVLSGGRGDLASPVVRDLASKVGRALLVVDDAHLLDGDAARVLWQLCADRRINVVATVRAGVGMPEQLARLWTSGTCERIDLMPLNEAATRLLLEEVLGGDVDDRLARVIVEQAAGNALLIRELIRSGVESGAIAQSHQLWRLAGKFPLRRPVVDLIRATLAGLTEAETVASQLLALAESTPINVAERMIEPSVLEDLESKRVAVAQTGVHGLVLTLAHPLYAELIRADLSPLRSRRLQQKLIDAFENARPVSDHDALRCVLWRLDLNQQVSTEELLHAVGVARNGASTIAERLARAAVDASESSEAQIVLAEVLLMQGRIAESDSLLNTLVPGELTQAEEDRVVAARTLGRTRLGQVSGAAGIPTVDSGEAIPLQLQALHAQALMLDGRLDQSLAAAGPVFADEQADPVARAFAAFALAARATFAGAIRETEPVLRAALPLATATRAAVPYSVATVQVCSVIALANAGRLDDAAALSQQMYDDGLRQDDEWLLPRGASGLGVVALLRGQPRTALKYFRITVAALNQFDEMFLRYNLSYLARAAAAAGLTQDARRALVAPPDAPQFTIFGPDWDLAEAATLAASADLAAAIERALHAARSAAALGAWMPALAAAHDAVRYGGASLAHELVVTAAAQVDAPLPRAIVEHTRARADNDPVRLTTVSERFERLGTIQYAAEASYAAAHAFRHLGDPRAAARASVRATGLHDDCEHAAIGWIADFHNTDLTPREQQIAMLAAAGHSDTAIAARLTISPRTVQTHLLRAYHKLSVTGRHDLPTALMSNDEPSDRPDQD